MSTIDLAPGTMTQTWDSVLLGLYFKYIKHDSQSRLDVAYFAKN